MSSFNKPKNKMSWWVHPEKPDEISSHSIVETLKSQGKINKKFVDQLKYLSLEEIIAIKLESVYNMTNKMYNFPINKKIEQISKVACLIYAYSTGRNWADAAGLLGLDVYKFKKLLKKYDVLNYFCLDKNESSDTIKTTNQSPRGQEKEKENGRTKENEKLQQKEVGPREGENLL